MTADEIRKAKAAAFEMLDEARIFLTPDEKEKIEVTDLGLGDFENVGLLVHVYVNTDRYCAKELILLPRQICPEHRHPGIGGGNIGKEETFRCRRGEVYLYVEGKPTPAPKARVPERFRPFLRAGREIVLHPGDQYTLRPNTFHWFQAGDEGAIVSEFSSTSTDENDVFTDPAVRRVPGDGVRPGGRSESRE
jgi:D-lyxose ketol-isomerase